MFTRVDETTSRSLDGEVELRTVKDKVQIWRRIEGDLYCVAVVEQPTIDRVQAAILRAQRVH